jgi:phosphoribosylaminoimidazole carboxylase PurE protein
MPESAVHVLILMGSESDREVMEKCSDTLAKLEIPARLEVASAHRNPDRVRELITAGEKSGVKVFICGAGMAAHLAGMVAAHTVRPVIGVPLAGSELKGFDSLLSTVQMPRGVPVATVAVGSHGAVNAAILAAQMLALENSGIDDRLRKLRAGTLS